ncbi:MAG TPA: hypothetical protein VK162_05255 [Streptosporangiaceae bacterium]|nr:hypothetical protein [Streptosporangiaceae bacterium]
MSIAIGRRGHDPGYPGRGCLRGQERSLAAAVIELAYRLFGVGAGHRPPLRHRPLTPATPAAAPAGS